MFSPDQCTHSSSISLKCFALQFLGDFSSAQRVPHRHRGVKGAAATRDEEMPTFGCELYSTCFQWFYFPCQPSSLDILPLLTPNHFIFNSQNSYFKRRAVIVHSLYSLSYIDHCWTVRIHPKHRSLKKPSNNVKHKEFDKDIQGQDHWNAQQLHFKVLFSL